MDRQATAEFQVPAAAFVSGLGPAMQILHDRVNEIAGSEIPVLVVGECGVGKDAYARWIHRLSSRSELRFHKVNCASFDTDLLPRQFRQSSAKESPGVPCGTLYLDNVQELDSSAQRILLSYLANGEDDDSILPLCIRFISSAAAGLESEIELNRFRRELYFRLNGICLRIPPLRERTEDIPLLAEHFLKKYSTAFKKNAPQVNDYALRSLSAYPWPGNIRELENFVRKAVLFGSLEPALNELHPFAPVTSDNTIAMPRSSLKTAARAASKKAERELILQALERTHWNRKRAARDLQISYKSLLYKIKQIGVSERKQES
jgi:DNA-binding NtrC family response regulator